MYTVIYNGFTSIHVLTWNLELSLEIWLRTLIKRWATFFLYSLWKLFSFLILPEKSLKIKCSHSSRKRPLLKNWMDLIVHAFKLWDEPFVARPWLRITNYGSSIKHIMYKCNSFEVSLNKYLIERGNFLDMEREGPPCETCN